MIAAGETLPCAAIRRIAVRDTPQCLANRATVTNRGISRCIRYGIAVKETTTVRGFGRASRCRLPAPNFTFTPSHFQESRDVCKRAICSRCSRTEHARTSGRTAIPQRLKTAQRRRPELASSGERPRGVKNAPSAPQRVKVPRAFLAAPVETGQETLLPYAGAGSAKRFLRRVTSRAGCGG